MEFEQLLDIMIEKNASDMFIRAKSPLRLRINTQIEEIEGFHFLPHDIENFIAKLIDPQKQRELKEKRSHGFTFYYKDHWRFRIHIFYQRNTLSFVVRKIDLRIPSFSELNLPQKVFANLASSRRGLVLLTGITGSGKSTSIASMIEYINLHYKKHVLTVEDPIEFTFEDKKAIINQREIEKDVNSYTEALRQFALQSPDVIFIGNINDAETCRVALNAAEAGVLVLSTIHSANALATIERIVNFFPQHEHHFVFMQLSFLLKGIISLRLISRQNKNELIPAYEVMTLSPSISRIIREGRLWELHKYMAEGKIYGMVTFDDCLFNLVKEKKISHEKALAYADRKEELELKLKGIVKI